MIVFKNNNLCVTLTDSYTTEFTVKEKGVKALSIVKLADYQLSLYEGRNWHFDFILGKAFQKALAKTMAARGLKNPLKDANEKLAIINSRKKAMSNFLENPSTETFDAVKSVQLETKELLPEWSNNIHWAYLKVSYDRGIRTRSSVSLIKNYLLKVEEIEAFTIKLLDNKFIQLNKPTRETLFPYGYESLLTVNLTQNSLWVSYCDFSLVKNELNARLAELEATNL